MRPFAELKAYEIAPAIVAGKRPEIPESVEKRFAKLIEKMWENDPDVRYRVNLFFEKKLGGKKCGEFV